MRVCIAFLVLSLSLVLAGCGGGAPPAAGVATPSSNLSGNWLLAGSLPVFGPPAGGNTGFGLAADFNVIGDQVFGALTQTGTCANGGVVGSAGFVTGTVAADGTFTLQTAALPSGTPPITVVTIKGKVPDEAGAGWSGTFAISNLPGSCTNSPSGAITATSIPLLNGTFTGTAELQTSGSTGLSLTPASTVSVPVSVTLQQSPRLSAIATIPVEASMLLTGTIEFQGASCISGGTTSGATLPTGTLVLSTVAGNYLSAIFAMNDGSTLAMSGSISALDASKIAVQFMTLSNGTCPAQFSQFTTLSH